MASYSGDFNTMQEEALARLREMQKRSRTAVNKSEPAPQHQHQQNEKHQPEPRRNNTDPLKSLLGDFKIDSEKALILLMLFVLYKNKADIKLLLALGYLLI